jgi:nucleoside-diphosphate-sugar epimerase
MIGILNGPTIVVAGATGNLGGRIARALLERGAAVKALVRHGTAPDRLKRLQELGVTIARVDFSSASRVIPACLWASCVVSALQGLRDVIVDTQTVLLDAAIQAGVPRFIPSDFSIDFTKFPPGENRNLDLRREFHKRLDQSSISATSILNGAFAELLTGQMPLILFKLKRVLYWGDADQRMDFTTSDDTAAFTASVALDPSSPRFLRIAGDQISAPELTAVVTEVTGKKFRLFRAGGLGTLGALIKVLRTLAPGEEELYPAWQGMQYMLNMFDGRAKLAPLDNDRYPGIRWTTAREVLSARPGPLSRHPHPRPASGCPY